MNILIVEDDPTDMKLLLAVLDSNGHHVVGKGSAELALEEIKVHKPDVIMLDLRLPGIDGLKLTRKLKKNKNTQQIPIIAMTAISERFNCQDALAAGCDAFIVKPVNTRTLNDQIVKTAAHKALKISK